MIPNPLVPTSRSRCSLIALFTLAGVTAACGSEVETSQGTQMVRVADILPIEHRAVDILFVIDDSGSMYDEQAQLAQWSSELFNVLSLDGELPDVHLAVTTSTVSIPGLPGCEGLGDGRFHPGQQGLLDGTFISDVSDGAGGRLLNYTGALTDVFSDIARVGASGCGFERPFEAVRRALDGSVRENDGFLREDALLLVVIVSDEDDCSASDTTLYTGHPNAGNDDLLGPLTSFRCFEFGVQCDAGNPRLPGAQTACVPHPASPYMGGVEPFADFLRGLKSHPGKVLVAGIFGDPDGVSVARDDFLRPVLEPSCTSVLGDATPGIRYNALLEQFPNRSAFSSICDGDLSWGMRNSARAAKSVATRSPCLSGAIADTDPTQTGLQPRCRASWATNVGTDSEATVEIPRCAAEGDDNCYRLVADSARCSDTATQLAVSTTGAIAGTLRVECELD